MNVILDDIPQKPGVYMWMDQHKTILYIGKAKNLKVRMKQYFKGMLNSYKTAQLVQNIDDYNYIITKSEKEALILERNLIQKHLPSYNILLTDDKRYPYIKIKLSSKLEISLVYRVASRLEKATYFGPFPTGYGARKLTNLIQRLATYENGLPIQNQNHAFWLKKYHYAKKLLSTQNRFLIKELEKKMKAFASSMQYELAANLKSNIEALKHNQSKQLVEISKNANIDVIGFVESHNYLFISMLFYRNGILLSRRQKVLEIIASKHDLIRQFVSQYYQINIKPDFIISNQIIETDLQVLVPKSGQNKQILNLALDNARDNKMHRIKQYKSKVQKTIGAIRSLQKLLKIQNIKRLIMIDNSNTSHFEPVSGIVSYVNGIKQPSEYRKYKLKLNARLADVEYIKQGLTKYFNHSPPPIDVLIVDGGKQQISEAQKVVPLGIKVLGLVKDNRHRTRALLNEDGNVIKVQNHDLWLLLNNIQEEADRYARSYHVKRRRSSLEGFLVSIKGIGAQTEKKLLNHFKNYAAIYNASLNDLEIVVSKKIAIKIKESLNESNSNFR